MLNVSSRKKNNSQRMSTMGVKAEFVSWFKGLSPSHRFDLLCVLLDHCVCIELRILLTVIENLGKRDFYELRDVEHKANSLTTIRANLYLNEKMTLVSPLCEPSVASANSHYVQSLNPSANSFNQVNDTSANRPSPTHHLESKTRSPGPVGCQTVPVSQSAEPQILSMVGIHNLESSYTSSGNKGGHHIASSNSTSNQIPNSCRVNSGEEDEDEYKNDAIIITDELRRKRLIMYLCLFKPNPTNLECAKVYYRILTEIDAVINSPGWLDGLDEVTLEEFAMLYTVGNNHPGFTFEQRTYLGEKLSVFQNQIAKLERTKPSSYPPPAYYIPQPHGYYIVPHIGPSGPQGNNPTTENGRTVERYYMPSYAPFVPLCMPPYHHAPVQATQQATHPYTQNMIGAAISPQASAGSPVTPTQPLLQQQPVPLSGPSSSSSSSSIQQFPKAQQAATQSQQSSVSTPTRTLPMANTVTAFQSQTNSLDGNESEECLWDSPESSPFESPPQSLTPSRGDSPTVAQRNTVTQSSAPHPSHAPFPSSSLPMVGNSTVSCNSIPESLCSSTSIATAIGAGIGGTAMGLNQSRPNKTGTNSQNSAFIHAQEMSTGSSAIKPLTLSAVNLALNGLKISSNDRRTAKQPPPNSIIYSSNQSSNNCVHIPSMMPQPHHTSSSGSSGTTASAHAMTITSSPSSNPSASQIQQNNSSHSQQFVHSSQSQYVNSGNSVLTSVNSSCLGTASRTPSGSSIPVTSIMNCGNGRSNSVSTNSGNVYNHIQNSNISTLVAFHHPVSLPIAQQHHTQANTGGGTPDGSNTVYGNSVKSLPPLMPSHSRLKPNSSSNPSNSMNTSAMLAQQSQQIMAQVQNPPPAAVNSVGVGTHSISSNPSLVNYQHGPMPLGGPPQVNNFGAVAAYSNVGAPPPYSSMGFRSSNNQQTINSRNVAYISHNNPMINNQIVLKQQQDQRSHNLSSGMNHGRPNGPKSNTSGVQAQNTPKRRNTSTTNTSSSNTNVGSNGGNGNQHNMQCKGEDTTENESCLS